MNIWGGDWASCGSLLAHMRLFNLAPGIPLLGGREYLELPGTSLLRPNRVEPACRRLQAKYPHFSEAYKGLPEQLTSPKGNAR